MSDERDQPRAATNDTSSTDSSGAAGGSGAASGGSGAASGASGSANPESTIPVRQGRKRASRAEKRRQIRHAAYRCFSRSGYHGTTVDDVCEAAGVSKGTFYWYFGSKQEVFVDIIDTWADEVQGQMKAQFRSALESDDPFAAMVGAVERESHRSGAVIPVWLEFLTEAGREPAAREVLAQFHNRLRRVLAELLEIALDDSVSGPEVEALASSALAMFFGLLCQELAEPDSERFSTSIRGFLAVIARAVAGDRGEHHE